MAVASGSTLSVRLTLAEAETFKQALNAIATDGATNLAVLQGAVQKLSTDFVALTDKQSLANKASEANAARTREAALSYTSLKASLDPVYGALVKYQQQLDIVETARARGAAGDVDAANTARLANEAYQETILSLNLMSGAWGQAQKAAKENAAEVERATTAYQGVRASLDPAYAALQHLNTQLAACDEHLNNNAHAWEEVGAVVTAAKAKFAETTQSLTLMSDAWALSVKAAEMNAAASERLVAAFNSSKNAVDPLSAAMATYQHHAETAQAAVGHLGVTQEDANRVINLARVALDGQLEKLTFVSAALDQQAAKTAAAAAANAALGAAFDRQRAATDPLWKAQQELARAEADVSAAVDAGVRTQEAAIPVLANLRAAHNEVVVSLTAMSNAEALAAEAAAANQAAQDRAAASFVALRAGVDPLYGALVAYNRVLAESKAHVDAGTASQEEANIVNAAAKARYDAVENSLGAVAIAARKDSEAMRQLLVDEAAAEKMAADHQATLARGDAAYQALRNSVFPAEAALNKLNDAMAFLKARVDTGRASLAETAPVIAALRAAAEEAAGGLVYMANAMDLAEKAAAMNAAASERLVAAFEAELGALNPTVSAWTAYARSVTTAEAAIGHLGVTQEDANRVIGLAKAKLDAQLESLQGTTKALEAQAKAAAEAAARNEALGLAFDRVRAATDPLFRAEQELAAAEAALNAGVAAGVRDKEVAATAIANLRMEYDLLLRSLTPMGNAEALAAAAADANTAAQEKSAAALAAMRASVDPMYAAIVAYERAVRQATDAVAADEGVRAQANATLAAAKARYDEVYASISEAAKAQRAAAAASAEQVAAEKSVRDAYDQTKAAVDRKYAATQAMLKQQEDVARALMATAISAEEAKVTLDQISASYAKATTEVTRHGHAIAGTRTLNAGALQELIVLAHEMVQGTYSRIPGSLMVFAEMTGGLVQKLQAVVTWAKSTAGIITLVAAGATAIGAAAVAAYELQIAHLNTLQQHLRATRTDYMELGEAAEKAAKQAAVMIPGLSSKDAKEIAGTLFSAPEFDTAKQSMTDLMRIATDLAKMLGEKVPEAAKVLVGALRKPGEEATKLANDAFPGLSFAMAHNIEMMEKQGDKAGATAALLGILRDRTAGAAAPVTDFGKAIEALGKGFDRLAQAMGPMLRDVGGPLTQALVSVVNALSAVLEKYNAIQEATRKAGDSASLYQRIMANLAAGMPYQMAIVKAYWDTSASGAATANTAASTGVVTTTGTPPAQGQPGWRPGNVLGNPDTSATGMFQITDATALDLGVNSLDYAENIRGGVKRILAAWQTWNGDVTSVAKAYEQGDEGLRRINSGRALQTSVTEAARYAAEVKTQNPASLPAKARADIEAEAARQGANPAQLELILKVAMQESKGQHWDTRATAAQTNGRGIVAGRTAVSAYDTTPVPAPSTAIPTAINDATRTAIGVPTPEATRAALAATMQALQAQKDALLAVGASGKRVYEELGVEGETSLHLISNALTAVSGTAYKTRTPLEEILHTLTVTATTADSAAGYERELAKVNAQLLEAAKSQGLTEVPADITEKAHALVMRTQDQATLDATFETSRRKADEAVAHWTAAKAALEAVTPSGEMLFKTMGAAGEDAYRRVNEGLALVTGTAYTTRSSVDEIIHSLEQQALTATKTSGIERDLAKLDVSLNEAAKARGRERATDAELAAAHVAFLAQQFQTVADGSSQEARRSIDAKVKYWSEAKAKMEVITESGKPLYQTEEGGEEKYRIISEGLQVLQGQSYKTRDAVQEVLHGLELQAQTANVASGATLELARSDAALEEAARGMGLEHASAADIERGRLLTLKNLDRGFRDQVDSLERTTRGNDALTASLAAGGVATEHLTNQIKAEDEARKVALKGTEEYRIRVAALTAELDKTSLSASNTAVQRSTLNATMQTSYIEAEIASLGMDSDKRTILLAQLQAELTLRQSLKPVSAEQAAAAVSAAGRQAEAQVRLNHGLQVSSDIASEMTSIFSTVGNSITDALTKGSASGVTFKSVLQGIESALGQFLLKISLLNPLLNTLFGQHLTTISDVGGVVGSLFANDNVPISTSTTTTNVGGDVISNAGTNLTNGSSINTDNSTRNFITGAAGTSAAISGAGGSAGSTLGTLSSGLGLVSSGAKLFGYELPSLSGIGSAVNAWGATNLGLSAGPASALATGNTAIGTSSVGSFTGGTTLLGAAGGVAGGLAGGYTLGNMFGGLTHTGNTQNTKIGSGIGAVAGTAIGTIILPGIGSLIGGLIGGSAGGTLGSLFGPGKPNPAIGADVGIADDGTHLAVGAVTGAHKSQSELDNFRGSLQKEVDDVNKLMDTAKIRMDKIATESLKATVGSGFAGSTGETLNATDAFRQLRFKADDTSSILTKVLDNRAFSNVDELNKAATFGVNYDTLVKTKTVTGSLNDAIAVLNKTFDDMVVQAKDYGIAEGDLNTARAKAIKAAQDQAAAEITARDQGYTARLMKATGDDTGAQIYQADIAGKAELAALAESFKSVYGDSYSTMDTYVAQVAKLNTVLSAEHDVLQKQVDAAIAARAALISENANNLQLRRASLAGDQKAVEFLQFEQSAVSELAGAKQKFEEAGIAAWQVAEQINDIETVQGAERAALVKKWADAATAALSTSNDSLATRRATLAGDQEASELLALAQSAASELTQARATFAAAGVSAAAAANQILAIETVQGAERVALVKKWADAATAAFVASNDNIALRLATLGGDQEAIELLTQSQNAIKELAQARAEFTAAGVSAADSAAQILAIEQAQGAERAAIVQKYADAAVAAMSSLLNGMNLRVLALDSNQQAHDLAVKDQTSAEEIAQAKKDYATAKLSPEDAAAQLAALQSVQAAERAAIIKRYADDAVTAAQATLTNALGAQISAIQEQISTTQTNTTALHAVADNLKKYLADLATSEQSPLTPQQQLAAAQAQLTTDLAAAGGGDVTAAGALTDDATKALDLAAQYYGKASAQYSSLYASTSAALQAVQTKFDLDATVADQQLSTLNESLKVQTAIRDALTGAASSNAAALQAASDAAVAALKVAQDAAAKAAQDAAAAATKAREDADKAKTAADADTKEKAAAAAKAAQDAADAKARADAAAAAAAKEAADAKARADAAAAAAAAADAKGRADAAAAAAAAAAAKPVYTGTAATIAKTYEIQLGREVDAAGLAYWLSHWTNQVDFMGAILASDEYKTKHAAAGGGWIGNGLWGRDSVVAAFAGGGDVALAGGEFVVNAMAAARYSTELPQINRGTYSSSNDNSEIIGLRREVAALRQQMAQLIQITAAGHVGVRDAVQAGNAMQAAGQALNKMRAAR